MPSSLDNYMSILDASQAWGVDRRYLSALINQGRIPGVLHHEGTNTFFLPKSSSKPYWPRKMRNESVPTFPILPLLAYRSLAEIAESWGVSARRVHVFVSEGRVPGVVRFAGRIFIPAGTPKPTLSHKSRYESKP